MTGKQDTVLIVDDESAIRQLLQQKLTRQGYRCLTAGNADEAMIKLKTDDIAAVVLDVKMPGKSGVELLPEIKAGYPDTAVVMATAITDVNIAVECMRSGAYDYINKPFNLDEVSLSVERALEKRRLILENRDYQQHLEQKVDEQAQKIRAFFFNAIAALANALEAKDNYTSGHSERVARLAVTIAKQLELPSNDQEMLRLAGLVHDIGKIGVSDTVLNKPDHLTREEYEHVKSHPAIGGR
ncbi:MAG: response regulator, partial [Chloroflexi bacterium]|nr:response regulator [Chloroflexota bacterium]